MLKRIVIMSATVTGLTLGVLGTHFTTDRQPTEASLLDTKIEVRAVDSLADMKTVQLMPQRQKNQVVTKNVSETAQVQNTNQAVTGSNDDLTVKDDELVNNATVPAEPKAVQAEVAEIATSTPSPVRAEANKAVPVATSEEKANQSTASASEPAADMQWLITRESHGDPHAQNGSYYGIGQLSENYYEKYVPGQDYRGNYGVQLVAMQKYIAERYGTVGNAITHWQANNWY